MNRELLKLVLVQLGQAVNEEAVPKTDSKRLAQLIVDAVHSFLLDQGFQQAADSLTNTAVVTQQEP